MTKPVTKTLSVEKLYKLLDKFMAEIAEIEGEERPNDEVKLNVMEYLRFVSKHRNEV